MPAAQSHTNNPYDINQHQKGDQIAAKPRHSAPLPSKCIYIGPRSTVITVGLIVHLLGGLSGVAGQDTVDPTWTADTELNSGQCKVIQYSETGPSNFTHTQNFNSSFPASVTPYIVLSLFGYEQQPPASNDIDVGFTLEIFDVTDTGFSTAATVYGANMTVLYYMYMGISPQSFYYTVEYMRLEIADSAWSSEAGVNTHKQVRSNLAEETYPDYLTHEVKIFPFLIGYKINIGTTGITISVDMAVESASTYSLTVQSINDVSIKQVTIIRLSFDKTIIEGRRFIYWLDLSAIKGTNNVQEAQPWSVTLNNFQYRNFMWGFTKLQFLWIDRPTDIYLVLSSTGDNIFKSSVNSTGTYNGQAYKIYNPPDYSEVYGLIFHLRVRQCPISNLYYMPADNKCYKECPDDYYGESLIIIHNSSAFTHHTCLQCHYSCLTCKGGRQQCLTCKTTDKRQLLDPSGNGYGQCACNPGFFDNETELCAQCSSVCKECEQSADRCTSCEEVNQGGQQTFRELVTNSCKCMSGYFEKNSLLVCELCAPECETCTNTPTNCLSCDPVLRYLTASPTTPSESICKCKYGADQINPLECASPPSSPVCGDGLVMSPEQCDDQNTENSDGCSSTCKIQEGHACRPYRNGNGTSLCYYNRQVEMSISLVLKLTNANKILLVLTISSQDCNSELLTLYFQRMKAIELFDSRRLLLNFEQQSSQEVEGVYDPALSSTDESLSKYIYLSSKHITISEATYSATGASTGKLNLILQYSASISTLKDKAFRFSGSDSESTDDEYLRYFSETPSSNIQLQDPYNKVPMTYYSDGVYQSISALTILFLVLAVLYLLFLLIGVALRISVIPVQCVLVFQFAMFGILGQTEVEIGLSAIPLLGHFITGGNVDILGNSSFCAGINTVYFHCNAIDNLNIPIYFAMVCSFFCLAVQAYKHYRQNRLNQLNQAEPPINYPKQQQQPRGSCQSYRMYKMPKWLNISSSLCQQFAYAVAYINTLLYIVTACFQSNEFEVLGSAIWLAVIGLLYAWLWINWFYRYPLRKLSFVEIGNIELSLFSIPKLHYFGLFMFMLVWGMLISLLNPHSLGIVAYVLLVLLCAALAVLNYKQYLYVKNINRIRGFINQSTIIIVTILEIVAEYGSVGDGIAIAIVIAVLLFGCLIANVVVFVLVCRQKKQDKNGLYGDTEDDELIMRSSRNKQGHQLQCNLTDKPNIRETMVNVGGKQPSPAKYDSNRGSAVPSDTEMKAIHDVRYDSNRSSTVRYQSRRQAVPSDATNVVDDVMYQSNRSAVPSQGGIHSVDSVTYQSNRSAVPSFKEINSIKKQLQIISKKQPHAKKQTSFIENELSSLAHENELDYESGQAGDENKLGESDYSISSSEPNNQNELNSQNWMSGQNQLNSLEDHNELSNEGNHSQLSHSGQENQLSNFGNENQPDQPDENEWNEPGNENEESQPNDQSQQGIFPYDSL